MKIRITIEYDTDGATLEQEQNDWHAGRVTFEDIAALIEQEDDPGMFIKFEEI